VAGCNPRAGAGFSAVSGSGVMVWSGVGILSDSIKTNALLVSRLAYYRLPSCLGCLEAASSKQQAEGHKAIVKINSQLSLAQIPILFRFICNLHI